MTKTKKIYCTCCCGMDVLRIEIDKKNIEGCDYSAYFTLFSSSNMWQTLKYKIKGFFSILFFGNTNWGQQTLIIDKDDAKAMLTSLKKATGYEPKINEHTSPHATYFADYDTFNYLLVEPEVEDDSMVFWMCSSYLFWKKKWARWSKAWAMLRHGCWTIDSLEMDQEEVELFMNYLGSILKLDWREFDNEDEGNQR